MVNVWGKNDVPGAASQQTHLESEEVEGEVGDDHFHDFIREWGGRVVHGMRPWNCIAEEAVDLGFASAPNSHHVIYPYGMNGADIRTICMYQ